MGKVTRKRYGAEFKAKVALEAIKGELTLAELSAKHGIHQTVIAAWKSARSNNGSAHWRCRRKLPLRWMSRRTNPR